MFWGLIMEPKRRYTQTVKRPFHVSMAALDIFSSNNEPCQVMLNFEERNYLLCTLQKGKDVQCVLDLNFEAGNKVIFATNGDSNVHLTGYLVEDLDDYLEEEEEEVDEEIAVGKKRKTVKVENQPPKKKSKTEQLLDEADTYDSNDDESFTLSKLGEEEDDSDASASSDDEIEDENDDLDGEEEEDEDDEDNDDEETEESLDEDDEDVSSLSDAEEKQPKSKLNGVASKKKQKDVQKKVKRTEQKEKSPNVANESAKGEKTPNKQDGPKAGNIQKANKTPKGEKTPKGNKGDANQKNGSAVKTPKEQQTGSPQKRTLEGGIIIQDLVLGDGQVVKPGKLAEVYYEGRLKQNNKVFDKLSKGAGFKFRLGKQEVIKGWDIGVVGMKIGGKRRIICPPKMAYGQKGSPPQIPPNSTLVFDVELKNIK